MRNKFPIFLIMLAAILIVGCDTQNKGTSSIEVAPIPVIAMKPEVKDLTLFLETIGTLQPSVFMEVKSEIDGTLEEILTSEGATVDRGTPLFGIDPKPYLMKVKEAEAQLTINQANLLAVEKKLARFKPLVQKNLLAQTEWEDLESEAKKMEAMIALDEVRLKSTQLDLEHCQISSPISGRVGKLDAHPGYLISKGNAIPLATISQMNSLIVEFSVTEKEFPKIMKERQKIEIKTFSNQEGNKLLGAISFLDNHYDQKTGLLLIRGKIPNEDYLLRPGQKVRVNVPIGIENNAIFIPQKAIRYNQEGPYLYIVQPDQTVSIRQIILGEERGNEQVVREGLDPSEIFIVDGHLRLSPGLKVEMKS